MRPWRWAEWWHGVVTDREDARTRRCEATARRTAAELGLAAQAGAVGQGAGASGVNKDPLAGELDRIIREQAKFAAENPPPTPDQLREARKWSRAISDMVSGRGAAIATLPRSETAPPAAPTDEPTAEPGDTVEAEAPQRDTA